MRAIGQINQELAELPDAEVYYSQEFLPRDTADLLFRNLSKDVPWQQDQIRLFGKTYDQPRLTALFASNGRSYSYSGITMSPLPFNKDLLYLQKEIKAHTGIDFTTCLINLYRDGSDSNGWHADDEKELGKNPPIASISLGEPRYFHMKHRREPGLRKKILLEHGSLLLMLGPTQHHWLHQVAKTRRKIGPRINLTFRVIQ